ncbi:MAG: MBL fold metallo-hydrolase [Candidatus Lokiarchaeota archaeon]|nr:MBL fold metallo-hydrolase [Candidatus Lokiarchaeota archaeon]
MKEIVKDIYYIKPNLKVAFDSFKYLIDSKSDDGLIIIDPGIYIDFVRGVEEAGYNPKDIKHCLITHAHLDHYGACHELQKYNNNIEFYAHELDAQHIEQKYDLESIEEFWPGYDYNPVSISRRIKNNEILKFGQLKIRCIHTPGHSQGAVTYSTKIDGSKIIFAGDIGGWTLKIYGSEYNDYMNSMQRLKDLKMDILCDGHQGVIQPAKRASLYIQGFMEFNKNLHIAIEEDPSNVKAWYNLALQSYDMCDYDFALDFCNYLLEKNPKYNDAKQLLDKIKKHNPCRIDYIKTIVKRYSK